MMQSSSSLQCQKNMRQLCNILTTQNIFLHNILRLVLFISNIIYHTTMTESANLMPFVCKWLYSHSKPQHFESQKKLRKHIDKHDINSCNRASIGDPIYICPWESCNKHQSSIT